MSKRKFGRAYLAALFFLGFITLFAPSCIVVTGGNSGWNPFLEEGEFERTFQVLTPAQLEISNGSGNVRILAGEETKITINARVKVRSSNRNDARKYLDEIIADPPVKQSGNKVIISHPSKWSWRGRSYSIDYEIRVPSQTEIRSSTGSGDQFIDGVGEQVVLEAGSGDIEASNIRNTLSVHTGSGDVKVRSVEGNVEITAGSGDPEIEDVAGSLRVNTGSGEVRAKGVSAKDVNIITGSGDISFEGELKGDSTWEVHASSGNVSLSLPSDCEFNINMKTSSGSLEIDFPLNIKGRISRKTLEGSVGTSNSHLICVTSSGDIRIISLK
jgi:DUF4097 and DUF4098 domain-containing protein YvlB